MKIKFEGQTHQIDANTLINTLIHYQSVITEANKGLSGGAKAIELKVNAFEKGSFVVDVSIEESFILQMFSGDTMEYLANLATVVGGVFAAYKILKGKPAKSDKEKDAITININNNNIVVNQTIINVYNQPLVREAVSKSIETADADANVEGLIVDSDGQKPVVFKKENFKEYIYNDFKDIIEQKNTKQHIFRKQILNDNLFGKLTIFPTGEVYSNVNFPTIGNIQDQKLSEIVYSEIENYFKPWFFTRDYVSCKNCVNKYLCPSISNYEIVANEYNMCYLNQ